MNLEQLNTIIDGRIDEKAKSFTAPPEDQIKKLIAEQSDEFVAGQLKEQFEEAKAKLTAMLPVENEETKAAKEKAKGFPDGKSFLGAVMRAKSGRGYDPRLTYLDAKGEVRSPVATEQKTAGHMEVGDDAQGGFLVPEIFKASLLQMALEESIVRPHGATVLPMTTDSLKIPYVDDTTHASTVFGGVLGQWTAEAAAKSATKPKFGQLELVPHKYAGITYASDELRSDSATALEPLITYMFGSAWGYFQDDAYLVGTGVGQPLGIQNCNCMINNLRHTSGDVMLEDLAEMWSRLLPSSKKRAYWIINPTVLPRLIQLGSGNAAAASGKNLVWIDNAAKSHPVKILGRPVIESEKMQALGTAGDIGLYDFRYYLIGNRQDITIDVSSHVAFTTDEICWRFVFRVAGQCWPQSAMTLRRGGTSVSPFVQLSAETS